MVERMRVATRGLIVGYSLILIGWLSVYTLFRLGPGLGKYVFAFFAGITITITHAVALSVFGGSVVCATRCLYAEHTSRTVAGYIVFGLSVLSVGVLGFLSARLFVIGH